jgi:hypothetical protein
MGTDKSIEFTGREELIRVVYTCTGALCKGKYSHRTGMVSQRYPALKKHPKRPVVMML